MKHLYQTRNKKNYFSFIKFAAITAAIISLSFNSFSQTSNTAAISTVKDASYPLSFIATLKNSFKVVLNWNLAAEKNTSHFVIQRSSDGYDFDDAAVIFTDNDNIKENYRFADNISLIDSGILYYRLKIVGLDGKSEYSKIETIQVEKKTETGIAVNEANPSSDIVTIKYPATNKSKQ
jgi:hypothetical protein